MFAIASDQYLYRVKFVDSVDFDKEILKIASIFNVQVSCGDNAVLNQLKSELALYFQGTLQNFETPVYFLGSDFQKRAWQTLQSISYGNTISYTKQAYLIGNDKAFRAVARANSLNPLAIIVPCHRVIAASGSLSGYAGGVERKKWLLQHEKNNARI